MIELQPKRLEGLSQLSVVDEPAAVFIDIAAHCDFAFERVTVKPPALMAFGGARQRMRRFKAELLYQIDFHSLTILASQVPLFKPADGCAKLVGVTQDEALDRLRETGRPFVTVKYAQTLDGRIATRTGDSKWISGEPARRFAHQLRAEHEAIMVGIGTVLADDPQLTVRLIEGRDPVRVIVDSRLRTPLTARLLNATGKTLIACGENAEPARASDLRRRGVDVVTVPGSSHHEQTGRSIELSSLLELLGRKKMASVLVEGGSRIITSLLTANLVDRLVVAVVPVIVGEGVDAIGDLGIERISDAIRLSSVVVRQLGDDVVLDGRPGRV